MNTDIKINETMKTLQIEFYKIQCQNWIPSKSKGNGAAGRTLEILLNKPADKAILPDYHGIEIKTQVVGSKFSMSLFSMAFDNKPLEIQRLLKIGGYPDKNHPEFKVFYTQITGNTRKKVGRYFYQLKVDYQNRKVRLLIFDFYGYLKDGSMSWSFDELQSRLEHKLRYLAFIPTRKWKLKEKIYYKYVNINFFRLKNFDTFLKLIQNGIITVTFKIGYYQYGELYGQIYDHGTTFEIPSQDLEKLFVMIYL